MHSFLLNIFFNFSVVIAAVIAAIRFNVVFKQWEPFVLFIWLGFLNETLSLVFIYTKGYNTVNSNIYVLIECFLLLYQFYRWGTITQQLHYILWFTSLLVWCADNLVRHTVFDNNSFFRIFYAVLIICCSVKQLNKLAETERCMLCRKPMFLVCTAFLFYYSCKVFVEMFNAFHFNLSHAWYRHVFTILYVADFVSNIIYSIALLCIPRKQLFTMPS